MPANTPQTVQRCHELLLWLVPQLDKFPRLRRFTLGERLEAALLEVLELLVEAAYTRCKEASLKCANLRLEVVRYLWRLGHEQNGEFRGVFLPLNGKYLSKPLGCPVPPNQTLNV